MFYFLPLPFTFCITLYTFYLLPLNFYLLPFSIYLTFYLLPFTFYLSSFAFLPFSFFYPFSHTVTHSLQNILKTKTSHWSKVLNRTILDFSQTHAHIFQKQIIIDRIVLKMQRHSSVTLHVSPETPISEGSKNNFHKNQNFASHIFFLSDLVLKLLNLFAFESFAWKIGSNWSLQRNVGFVLERAQTSKHCCRALIFDTKIVWSQIDESYTRVEYALWTLQ